MASATTPFVYTPTKNGYINIETHQSVSADFAVRIDGQYLGHSDGCAVLFFPIAKGSVFSAVHAHATSANYPVAHYNFIPAK